MKKQVRVHENGDMHVNKKNINLKEANKIGVVARGMHAGFGANYSNNPYTIGASLGSGGRLSKKIYFDAIQDNDVVWALIKHISET